MEDFYKDLLRESKHQRTSLVVALVVVAILSICSITLIALHFQNVLARTLTETEFVTEYELITDNESFNSGNITVSR